VVRHYGRVKARTSDARLDGLGGVEAAAVLLGAPTPEKPAPQPGEREASVTRKRGSQEGAAARRGRAEPSRAEPACPRGGERERRRRDQTGKPAVVDAYTYPRATLA